MTRDSDGTPQPATQPLTQEEAHSLQERTGGQLQPFLHSDGRWYCYDARSANRALGIRPRWPVENGQHQKI